jgi:Ca2+-binding EF-hand superfamily protein
MSTTRKPRFTEEQLVVLNDDQVAEIRKAFNVCDVDGSGTIERGELAKVISELGENPSEEELMELLEDLDADGNGTIDWNEFLNTMRMWITEAQLSDSDDEEEQSHAATSNTSTSAPVEPASTPAAAHD